MKNFFKKARLTIAISCLPLALFSQSNIEKIQSGVDSLLKISPNEVGLQVAVLKAGEKYYSQGFGTTAVNNGVPIDTNSQFYIASTTKVFVGMLGAILAQKGQIDLDTSVTKYFPGLDFKQKNLLESKISLRDHFAQRTGYENDQLAFLPPTIGAIPNDRMVHLVSNYSKEVPITFNYRNESYIMAAAAMERATNKSWKSLLEEYIFDPLDLRNTTTDVERVKTKDEFAFPHNYINGRVRTIEPKANTNMHAAGGMISNAEDLLKWMQIIMNEGEFDGEQVLSNKAVTEALSIQTRLNANFFNLFQRYAYAFGWYHSDYDGDLLIHCFGGFIGYHCHMSFMPEKQMAVVVLANASTIIPHLIAAHIYDILLSKDDQQQYVKSLKAEREYTLNVNKRRDSTHQVWVSKIKEKNKINHAQLTGRYRNEKSGEIEIISKGPKLIAYYQGKRSVLKNLGADEYLIHWSSEDIDFEIDKVDPHKLKFSKADSEIKLSWESAGFGPLADFIKIDSQ